MQITLLIVATNADFRPEYQQLGRIKSELFPSVPVMAVTATATKKVRDDIMKSLHMKDPSIFSVSFFRANLTFRVISKDYNKHPETGLTFWEVEMLKYVAERPQQSGIVYCLSRDDAETTARLINDVVGVPASHYHAGMTTKQRTLVQNQWRTGSCRVVCATIAFGMGIDAPEVRYVVHATMSKSLEGYYQEAGRAGRDGEPAECILFYGRRDGPRIINLIRRGKFVKGRSNSRSSFQREVAMFNAVTEYCCNQERCRHASLLEYLGEKWNKSSCVDKCDVCRGEAMAINKPSEKGGRRKRTRSNEDKEPEQNDAYSYEELADCQNRERAGRRSDLQGSNHGTKPSRGNDLSVSFQTGFQTASAALREQQQGEEAQQGKKSILSREKSDGARGSNRALTLLACVKRAQERNTRLSTMK